MMSYRERKRREKERRNRKPNILSSIIGTIFAIILLIKGYQAIKENYHEDEESASYSVTYGTEAV